MKKKRSNKRNPHRKSNGTDFTLTEHPLSGIDPHALKAAMKAVAERETLAFNGYISRINDIFSKKDPAQIISIFSAYASFTTVSATGVSTKSMMPDVQQHHVEMLQALSLAIPAERWGLDLAIPQDVQNISDSIRKLTEAFAYRRHLVTEGKITQSEKVVLSLQEKLRLHTQSVRNWGYFSNVVTISNDLYRPLDEILKKYHGFSATELLAVSNSLLELIEGRVSDRFKLLKRVFREHTPIKLVKSYHKTFPNLSEISDEKAREFVSDKSFEEVKFCILSHADLFLSKMMTVSAGDISQRIGVNNDAVLKILASLSLSPGALANGNPEHFFLSNPIWSAPLIRMGEDFFCPLPQAIFSHVHTVIRRLADMAKANEALGKCRSSYLENKAQNIISSVFQDNAPLINKKWHTGIPSEQYETDLLVVVDSIIIIIECKSHALTPTGLRGLPERVKRHIDELILGPSIQSARLEDQIWRAKSGDVEAISGLANFDLDFKRIESIVRISVTLDDFSILSSSELDLKEAGWIPESVQLAPTMNIADFECVADLLNRPAFFVHYMKERSRIQKSMEIYADELDFLGFYMQTGFNIWDIESQDVRVSISGMSRDVDHYYSSRDAGVRARKPSPKIHPYFSDLIRAIQSRKFPGWLSVSIDLLYTGDYSIQKQIVAGIASNKLNVKRNWRDPEHISSLILKPPPHRDVSFVFYLYPPHLSNTRRESADNLIQNTLETTECGRCVLIGKNLNNTTSPYNFIVIANKSDDKDYAEEAVTIPI
ncbi:MAG: hypothetical protein PW843_08780 [Azospirillaceae bacterium]|nr:hypothetical protein [Azospirillaceae bacterium]